MCELTDRLELLGICTEKANSIFDGSIPDDYYRLLVDDINHVYDAGYDGLFVLAHSFLSSDENKAFHVGCRGFMGASPVAYCCGFTQTDPLRCTDIPVFPELFHQFYHSRRKLPFFLELGMLPESEIMKSDFYKELSQANKNRYIYFTDNLRMLDILESEIGHREESLKYDGSKLSDYWLEALETYDAKAFKKKVLNLFPDFLYMDPSGLDLFIRLLKQKPTLNRRNLSRLLGILHSPSAIRNAHHVLDEGIPFDSAGNMDYIAYPEDIYSCLKDYIPAEEAIQLSLQLSLDRKKPDFDAMNKLISAGVPVGTVRKIWRIDHLYSSVQCYAHAGEFLQLCWYFENYYEDYIRLLCM